MPTMAQACATIKYDFDDESMNLDDGDAAMKPMQQELRTYDEQRPESSRPSEASEEDKKPGWWDTAPQAGWSSA